ncbi:MAG: SulP family sulfate permease [Alphaproteobacteria bacterium]|jgi:SulP family sulfate permease
MNRFINGWSVKNIKGDLFGGLTAAVVALPLALAFGVASGIGPIAGLYGAIAVGFFAALFGGTPAQISGPTGPMTVVMATIIASHANNLPEAFAIVMLGGALQIVFGIARFGRYIIYTPYSVVSGFMTGIGIIIIIIQLLPFVGLPASEGGPVGSLHAILMLDPGQINLGALMLAFGTLAVVIFWPKKLARFAPAPLVALVLGTLTSVIFLPNVAVIGTVPTSLPVPVMPSVSFAQMGQIFQAGFILALLGSIDSLLTSLVADTLTRTRHNSDRELIGQGIGNMIAGLIGGLPGAGATMRTVVNVRSGGRTPLSGMIHALVLLTLVLGLAPLAAVVPHAVLAGILMKVGYDIIDWGYVKRLARVPRAKALVMLVTVALTVFVDLITAVAVGIIIAAYVTSRALEFEQLKGIEHGNGADGDGINLSNEERANLRKVDGRVLVTRLTGAFSYASAREMARRVGDRVMGHSAVVYDFSNVSYIDPSTAIAIDDLFEQATNNGQSLFVCGLSGDVQKTLGAFDALERVPPERLFALRSAAIASAVEGVINEDDTSHT